MKFIKLLGLLSAIFVLSAAQVVQAKDTYNLNMRDAALGDFVELVSEATGQYFLLDPSVLDKKVTIISGREITAKELEDVFVSVLAMNSMVVAKTNNSLTLIVPEYKAKAQATAFIPEDVFTESAKKYYQSDELITTVATAEHVSVSKINPVMRPILSISAYTQEYSVSNSILITGKASNVIKAVMFFRVMDKPNPDVLEVVLLKYAKASELVETIKAKIEADQKIKNEKPTISYDLRSNAVLISGTPAGRAYLKDLIKDLDKPNVKDKTSP
jgi:general secretion pathway protein D